MAGVLRLVLADAPGRSAVGVVKLGKEKALADNGTPLGNGSSLGRNTGGVGLGLFFFLGMTAATTGAPTAVESPPTTATP